jgi:hypothetical protein
VVVSLVKRLGSEECWHAWAGAEGDIQRAVEMFARYITARMRAKVPKARSGVRHITDKMLFNWWNIGLIHLVFPDAVIIHTVRHHAHASIVTHRRC